MTKKKNGKGSARERAGRERQDQGDTQGEEQRGFQVSGQMQVQPAEESQTAADERSATSGERSQEDTDPAGDLVAGRGGVYGGGDTETRGPFQPADPAAPQADEIQDPAADGEEQGAREEDTRTDEERRRDEAVIDPRFPDRGEGDEAGSAEFAAPLEGLPGAGAITGEAPMAAWPVQAGQALSHRLLVTSPGEEADASADLAGATPYANWLESREGPNGTTWLVTVGEADQENFLAQCELVGAAVQRLEGDGSVISHVQGDEGAGWTHPADRDPEAEAEARRTGEEAREQDEAERENEDREEDSDEDRSPQKD